MLLLVQCSNKQEADVLNTAQMVQAVSVHWRPKEVLILPFLVAIQKTMQSALYAQRDFEFVTPEQQSHSVAN